MLSSRQLIFESRSSISSSSTAAATVVLRTALVVNRLGSSNGYHGILSSHTRWYSRSQTFSKSRLLFSATNAMHKSSTETVRQFPLHGTRSTSYLKAFDEDVGDNTRMNISFEDLLLNNKSTGEKRRRPLPPVLDCMDESEMGFGAYDYQPDPYDEVQIPSEQTKFFQDQQNEFLYQSTKHKNMEEPVRTTTAETTNKRIPSTNTNENIVQNTASRLTQDPHVDGDTKVNLGDSHITQEEYQADSDKPKEAMSTAPASGQYQPGTFSSYNGQQTTDEFMEATLTEKLEQIQTEIYGHNANKKFNINSPKQVSEVLFGSGATLSTNKDVLESMAANGNKIADLILQYRQNTTQLKKVKRRIERKSNGFYTQSISSVVKLPATTDTNVENENGNEEISNNDVVANKKTDPLLLVDTYSYIFRAYYAMPPIHRSDGMPVGAVLGFCNMLNKIVLDEQIKEGNCPRIILVFDHSGVKNFRTEIYTDYKANRAAAPMDLIPQFDLIREAAEAYGICQIEAPSYEADDVIATLSKIALQEGIDVNILSGDKDLMQLVTPSDNIPSVVQMTDPMRMTRYTYDKVIEKWGVPPEKIADLFALMGDSSDNIPGVPGIGPKIAAELINEYESLENLLSNHLQDIKQKARKEKLLSNIEQAKLSKQLVVLDQNINIDEMIIKPPKTAMIEANNDGNANTNNDVDDSGAAGSVGISMQQIIDMRMEQIGDGKRLLDFYDQMGFRDIKRRVEFRLSNGRADSSRGQQVQQQQQQQPRNFFKRKKEKLEVPRPEDYRNVPF